MTKAYRLGSLLGIAWLVVLTAGWQDDVDVSMRSPYDQFTERSGWGFFRGAQSEVRLGRYISAGDSHTWRGGAQGDVALMNWGHSVLWHMGLDVETLADNKNDINFRLVQVYYQAVTGLKLPLGPGVVHVGYRHRCNHGTDNASKGRITIRSGMTASYHWLSSFKSLHVLVKPGLNLYVLGQNSDVRSQPRGGAFVSAGALWPIREPWYMVMSVGANFEMVGRHQKYLYVISDSVRDWRIEPLVGSFVGLRIKDGLVAADFGLHFAQNLDNGIGERADKTNNCSFDINFTW